jgi:hypothetical protein
MRGLRLGLDAAGAEISSHARGGSLASPSRDRHIPEPMAGSPLKRGAGFSALRAERLCGPVLAGIACMSPTRRRRAMR